MPITRKRPIAFPCIRAQACGGVDYSLASTTATRARPSPCRCYQGRMSAGLPAPGLMIGAMTVSGPKRDAELVICAIIDQRYGCSGDK